jgi:signal transduction histidine kinase
VSRVLAAPRWWRRRSLRARLTIVATAGLALAVAAAAVLLWVSLRQSLIQGLNSTVRGEARQVAALADDHRLPGLVLPAAGTLTIQVLNASGRIVDASPGADRLVPLLPPARAAAAARSGRPVLMDGRPHGLPYLVWVVAVPARRVHKTVLAGADFAPVVNSVAVLAHALLVGTPLLLALLALVTWLVVGSTLRPIAALRRGAQEVTATTRPRALPVPEAHDEVRDLAVTLNDMLARLGAAHQRQRELVSDTAHELRSPIASIRAQLEVALDHPGQQDWRQTAAGVLADTLRLGRLAEDLLVLARLDEQHEQALDPGGRGSGPGGRGSGPGGRDSGPGGRDGGPGGRDGGPGRAADLAAIAVTAAERSAGSRVPVTASVAGPCPVRGDPEGLRRMVDNLVENALRYAASAVTVAVAAENGHALLAVTDDGPGIPPGDRERVFERFVRLDDARSREDGESGGAGLGLAIVRATARAHGGSAWLEDASPGLRAMVRLPGLAAQPGSGALPATPGQQ